MLKLFCLRRMVLVLASSITLFASGAPGSANAQGNNCDCEQTVSSCHASISVVPTESTKGSFGADLNIQSTAPICAKVEYYVDSTPYFTILSQGNRASDRVFGTKPITRANVSEISCKVCRRISASSANTEPSKPVSDPNAGNSINLTGTWRSSLACNYGTATETWELAQSDGSTVSISGKLGDYPIESGNVNGQRVSIEASHWLGNRVRMEGHIDSPSRMSGTYTQTAAAGTCQWEATKM